MDKNQELKKVIEAPEGYKFEKISDDKIQLVPIKNKMSKENKSLDYQQNGNDFIADVMRFYFKVNNSKLQDKSRLKNQIEKVIKRLVERNNIHSKSIELSFGTVDDDFVFDRCRLRISFNCA